MRHCCLSQVVDENSNVKIKSPNAGKNFAPEEISALVLRKLTDDAAKFLNAKVAKAVITVPAYFNDSQRQVKGEHNIASPQTPANSSWTLGVDEIHAFVTAVFIPAPAPRNPHPPASEVVCIPISSIMSIYL